MIQGLQRLRPVPDRMRCYISAYDANDRQAVWKFNTIARERRAGRRHLGQAADALRAGGETWIAGSYDPDLNLTYWGVAQAKPWMPRAAGTTRVRQGALHELDVALNADTGKLAWHYQHAPGESLDLDEVFERVLVDIGDQKVVFTIGKAGMLWKLDRRTGKLPRRTRRRSSRTSSTASIRRPASRPIAPTSSSSRSTSGCRRARAPRAATTGRR